MKKQKESFEKMVAWAREAYSFPDFELSSERRERVLSSWRRDAVHDGSESILTFLRWAVACSFAIMAFSILFNHDALQSSESPVKVDSPHIVGSPQMMFHARTSTGIYVP